MDLNVQGFSLYLDSKWYFPKHFWLAWIVCLQILWNNLDSCRRHFVLFWMFISKLQEAVCCVRNLQKFMCKESWKLNWRHLEIELKTLASQNIDFISWKKEESPLVVSSSSSNSYKCFLGLQMRQGPLNISVTSSKVLELKGANTKMFQWSA